MIMSYPCRMAFLQGQEQYSKESLSLTHLGIQTFGVHFLSKMPWDLITHAVFCADFHYGGRFLKVCDEQKGDLPIAAGEPFKIVIVCEATHFSVYIDGNHFSNFQHHAKVDTIQCLKVDPSVKVTSFSVDRMKFINWPLRNGFKVGNTIIIRGFLGTDDSSDEFDIHFQNGSSKEEPADIPLAITVRFKEEKMINNTYQSKVWGEVEVHRNLFLQPRKEFEIAIGNRDSFFKVFVDDGEFCTYDMRVPYDKLKYLIIRDNVNISSIALTSTKIQPRIDDHKP